MTPTQTIPQQAWMADRDLQAVFAALQADDDPDPAILCVGGCVRDALMGRPVVDVDLATVHSPDITLTRLKAAGIATLEIGIEHGTVVARFGHKLFQITTLRVDVETDGRHAQVAYTDDWAKDASRRDFTMNALYAELDGNVFDPLGGAEDIAARRVRFIGDASERIREDALRILRFYRFHAQIEDGEIDSDGLAACRASFDLIANLSGERVREELFKILLSPAASWMLRDANYVELLEAVLPETRHVDHTYGLSFLAGIEGPHDSPDPLRRIGAMIANADDAAALAVRLRLSNKEAARLGRMAETPPGMTPNLRPHTRKLRLYEMGSDAWRDAVLLRWAQEKHRLLDAGTDGAAIEIPSDDTWLTLLQFPETWPVPAFPLQGADVLALGVAQGPDVGQHLAAVENWWLIREFKPDHAACTAKLKRRLRWVGLWKRLGLG
jgi:poly(A) polymerase